MQGSLLNMNYGFRQFVSTLLIVLVMSICSNAIAATYGVSPLSVSFSGKQKSSMVTVVNEDKRPISLRVKAMAWTQDETGADLYTNTSELIFFPKRLDLAPGEKRVIRIGINKNDVTVEKAYRLYIEELPPAVMTESDSTRLSVLVTFGLPVFIVPEQVTSGLQLGSATVSGGSLKLSVMNDGRQHARLSRVMLKDGSVVTESIDGRYVFPGITKTISIPLSAALCNGQKQDLVIETESATLNTEVDMPASCGS